MRSKEASIIANALSHFRVDELSPMIEIGSSTAEFRVVTKPHIEINLHKPLRGRGVRLITTDLKTGAGIDISGSVYDEDFMAKIKEINPRALMCCNVLEHVENPGIFAEICSNLLNDEGILIISVPFDYPYHADPLDTLFRPGPEQLAELFPGFATLFSAIVVDGSYYTDIVRMNFQDALKKLSKDIKSVAYHLLKRNFTLVMNHRILWLFKSYKISIVILRKNA